MKCPRVVPGRRELCRGAESSLKSPVSGNVFRPDARPDFNDRAVMQITDLLVPESVFAALKARNKKQLFQELSGRAASLVHLPEKRIFETLNEREGLGTTGVGQGIAIPHGRLPEIEKISGLFVRLEHPVEYAAVDGQPVDLVFMLLAPEGAGADHLKALARVSRLLRNQTVCYKLRAAVSAEEMFAILTEPVATVKA
jgi:PTS system nitrogen regulatory IIA component